MSRQNRPEGWNPLEAPQPRKNDRVGLCVSVIAVAAVILWLAFAVWGWLQ